MYFINYKNKILIYSFLSIVDGKHIKNKKQFVSQKRVKHHYQYIYFVVWCNYLTRKDKSMSFKISYLNMTSKPTQNIPKRNNIMYIGKKLYNIYYTNIQKNLHITNYLLYYYGKKLNLFYYKLLS